MIFYCGPLLLRLELERAAGGIEHTCAPPIMPRWGWKAPHAVMLALVGLRGGDSSSSAHVALTARMALWPPAASCPEMAGAAASIYDGEHLCNSATCAPHTGPTYQPPAPTYLESRATRHMRATATVPDWPDYTPYSRSPPLLLDNAGSCLREEDGGV